MNCKRPVTGIDEHVNSEIGQMDLTIRPYEATRANKNTGVEELRPITQKQPEDAAAACPHASFDHFPDFRTID
jgi:hypothetical protein